MDTTRARDLGLAESLAGRWSRMCLCSRLSLWSHLKDFWFTMPSHFLFCLAKFCTLGVVGGEFFLLPVAAGDDEVKCQHIGDQLVLG
jgi:hypothetical protein